jgi:hypothetical protein
VPKRQSDGPGADGHVIWLTRSGRTYPLSTNQCAESEIASAGGREV